MQLKAFGEIPAGWKPNQREFLRKISDAVEVLIGIRRSQLDTTTPPRSKAVTFDDLRTVPSYADNAAAIVGGLKPGDIYRTDDALKVVHT
ncbi:MAG: hypothetical protein A4E71_00101 [Smithella sp. PtaU1.Bin162]|nr:MAG: hypothetical protein A4E71_00101 [Smithella sp. PtaU1.Bin162]